MRQTRKEISLLGCMLLVTGNVLGVGVLALPIKAGLGGFFPALAGIILIWAIMLVSAFVIAKRLPTSATTLDIPSFYRKELGPIGQWVATIFNLVLLYGVLVAYLSGFSQILIHLFGATHYRIAIVLGYFLFTAGLILGTKNLLQRWNPLLILAIFISFIILAISGMGHFNAPLLLNSNWKYLPFGLPIAVSAFHFHNIIPTLSRNLKHDQGKIRLAIVGGVGIGLIINLVWVTIVLATLPEHGGMNSLFSAYHQSIPATVPMADVLHSSVFLISSLIFALLSITASFIANGLGLFGFIRDLCACYLKTSRTLAVATLTFVPPLVVTLTYPSIFLDALDGVGGLGETVLFIILPSFVLLKLLRHRGKTLRVFALIMMLVGIFIVLFTSAELMGWIDLWFHLG